MSSILQRIELFNKLAENDANIQVIKNLYRFKDLEPKEFLYSINEIINILNGLKFDVNYIKNLKNYLYKLYISFQTGEKTFSTNDWTSVIEAKDYFKSALNYIEKVCNNKFVNTPNNEKYNKNVYNQSWDRKVPQEEKFSKV
jgi:hypothetical protein